MSAEDKEESQSSKDNTLMWAMVGTSAAATLLIILAYRGGYISFHVNPESNAGKQTLGSAMTDAGTNFFDKLFSIPVLANVVSSSVASVISCWYQGKQLDKQRIIELQSQARQRQEHDLSIKCKEAEIHESRAKELYNKKKFHEAQQKFWLAVTKYSEIHEANEIESLGMLSEKILKLKYFIAKCLLQNMQLRECADLLDEVLASKEDYVGALNLRGLIYFLQQRYSDATEIFRRSMYYNRRQNIIDKLYKCCALRLETSITNCFNEDVLSSESDGPVRKSLVAADRIKLVGSILRAVDLTAATSFFTPIMLEIYCNLNFVLKDSSTKKHHIDAISFAELFIYLYQKDPRFKYTLSRMFGQLKELYSSLFGSASSSSSSSSYTGDKHSDPIIVIPSYVESMDEKKITPEKAAALSNYYKREKEIIDEDIANSNCLSKIGMGVGLGINFLC